MYKRQVVVVVVVVVVGAAELNHPIYLSVKAGERERSVNCWELRENRYNLAPARVLFDIHLQLSGMQRSYLDPVTSLYSM